jgi:hypothetical protein
MHKHKGEYNIEKVCLNYPIFLEHISNYCCIKDIVSMYNTSKFIRDRLIKKNNKLWWYKSRRGKKDKPENLCYSIRDKYYDLCKLSFHDSYFTDSAIMLYTNKEYTNDTIKTIKDIVTINESKFRTNETIEKSIELMINSNLFLENVINLNLSKHNDEKILQNCLWIYCNILASNKNHVKWLYDKNVVTIIHNILLQKCNNDSVIDSCIWAISNLIGDTPAYLSQQDVSKCVISIFKYTSNNTSYNLLSRMIWFMSNLVKTKKKYIFHSVISFIIHKIDMINNIFIMNMNQRTVRDYFYLMLSLVLHGDEHMCNRIEYSGLLNYIVVKCLQRDVSTTCLETLVNFTYKYKPTNSNSKYILSILNILISRPYVHAFLSNKHNTSIGIIVSNIIINKVKDVSKFAIKSNCIIPYFLRLKRLSGQLECVHIFNAIIDSDIIEHIHYIIDKYKCLKYIFKILQDSYNMSRLSEYRKKLVCSCLDGALCIITKRNMSEKIDKEITNQRLLILEQYRNHKIECFREEFLFEEKSNI